MVYASPRKPVGYVVSAMLSSVPETGMPCVSPVGRAQMTGPSAISALSAVNDYLSFHSARRHYTTAAIMKDNPIMAKSFLVRVAR